MATESVVTLTGENGIISKAREAKELTERANIKEQIQMAIIGSYGQYGGLDYDELRDNLNKIEGITGVPATITDSSFPLTLDLDGYGITVQSNGTVEVEGDNSSGGDTSKVYTVTYHGNGVDGEEITNVPATQKVKQGNKVTISSTKPTREGYNFKGWSTNKNATSTDELYQPGQSYNLTSNMNLYAIWKIQETLTFKSPDGYYKTSIIMEDGILKSSRPIDSSGSYFSGMYISATFPTDCTMHLEFEYTGDGFCNGGYSINGVSSDESFNLSPSNKKYSYDNVSCPEGNTIISVAGGGGGGGTITLKILSVTDSTTGDKYKLTVEDYET